MDWDSVWQTIQASFQRGDTPTQLGILAEVAFAMFLGGLIGIERELADKPAGFRTHMIIAGVSCLLVGLGDFLLDSFIVDRQVEGSVSGIRSDPMRIVEAIVTGISFLGAGTIFRRSESDVRGLTTAASILLSAAIGICVALQQLWLAIGVTILSLIILRGLKFVERWIEKRRRLDGD